MKLFKHALIALVISLFGTANAMPIRPITANTTDQIIQAIDWQKELQKGTKQLDNDLPSQAVAIVKKLTGKQQLSPKEQMVANQYATIMHQYISELLKEQQPLLKQMVKDSLQKTLSEQDGQVYLELLNRPEGRHFLDSFELAQLEMIKQGYEFGINMPQNDPKLFNRLDAVLSQLDLP